MTEEHDHNHCIYCATIMEEDLTRFSDIIRPICARCEEVEKTVGKEKLKSFAADVFHAALCEFAEQVLPAHELDEEYFEEIGKTVAGLALLILSGVRPAPPFIWVDLSDEEKDIF